MNLKNIAIIVDGPTEEGSLKTKFEMTYHTHPNFRIGPGNGATYSIEGYAKGVLPTMMFLLKTNVRAIILIPDLEKRKEAREVFAANLKKEIIRSISAQTTFNKDYLSEIIFVCPPDIMFENWILSDIRGIEVDTELIKSGALQKCFDGMHGTNELQRIMKIKYKKTVHARRLYKRTNEDNCRTNSVSFKTFIDCFDTLRVKHCQ